MSSLTSDWGTITSMLEVVVLPYLESSSASKDRSRDLRAGKQEMPLRGKGFEARASASHYPHARNPGLVVVSPSLA